MTSKKILMIVGDFVEDYEVMVPFQMLEMVGHKVSVVSPDKKAGEFVKTAIHDFEGFQTYTEKTGHNFTLNATFDDIKESDFDALVIPGGRAPEYLRLNNRVVDIVKYFAKTNKPIASICHGPQLLVTANVVNGVLCTAYPAVKPDLIMAGAKWGEPNADCTNAFSDKNIVTAPAWPAHPQWMAKFLELLGTKIEA